MPQTEASGGGGRGEHPDLGLGGGWRRPRRGHPDLGLGGGGGRREHPDLGLRGGRSCGERLPGPDLALSMGWGPRLGHVLGPVHGASTSCADTLQTLEKAPSPALALGQP